MTESTIRELTSESEWIEAFPVYQQLRPELTEAEYLDSLERMSRSGYRLFGLFADESLVSVAGAEILVNMDHGRHLWVWDLVTDADARSQGHGRRLLEYLEDWAESRRCERIVLESGLQREEAHRFYEERTDMEKRSYVFTQNLE